MMLGKLFTLDNALMLGAFVIGPALLVGFLLLMGGFTRRSLMRRKRHPWSASDPAFKAAEKAAAKAGCNVINSDNSAPRTTAFRCLNCFMSRLLLVWWLGMVEPG